MKLLSQLNSGTLSHAASDAYLIGKSGTSRIREIGFAQSLGICLNGPSNPLQLRLKLPENLMQSECDRHSVELRFALALSQEALSVGGLLPGFRMKLRGGSQLMSFFRWGPDWQGQYFVNLRQPGWRAADESQCQIKRSRQRFFTLGTSPSILAQKVELLPGGHRCHISAVVDGCSVFEAAVEEKGFALFCTLPFELSGDLVVRPTSKNNDGSEGRLSEMLAHLGPVELALQVTADQTT